MNTSNIKWIIVLIAVVIGQWLLTSSGVLDGQAACIQGDDERGTLWARFVALNPDYVEYAERTKRKIPVCSGSPAER
jgi:transcriptional regulator GlxA family with amidase domain